MTVIACRDGIMAADSASWCGDIATSQVSKLFRLPNGDVMGCAGWRPVIDLAVAWMCGEIEKPAPRDSGDLDVLVLRKDGIWRIAYTFDFYRADDFAVAGSHEDFLLGAMAAGASAEDAVRLAIKYCRSARGEVQVMSR